MKTGIEQKILLVGGPFDFRTLKLPFSHNEVFIPIPTEIKASFDPYEPVSPSMKVAHYLRAGSIVMNDTAQGFIFEYTGTR